MRTATFFLCVAALVCAGAQRVSSMVVFIPLDDRPVTRQLPAMLGAIAGENVAMPPRGLLGRYLSPGDPEAIRSWLQSPQTQAADAFVVSTDMLAYGGLVTSRVPGTSIGDAISRLRVLEALHERKPSSWIAAFGTIMRLAPTAVPSIGSAADFFAAGPHVAQLQAYANLPDPPRTAEQTATAQRLREQIGTSLLNTYLQTRERNRQVDLYVLSMAAQGTVDRVVLGQDDAGPEGLHLRDLRALNDAVARLGIADRTSIEPGADELGMALTAAAFARGVDWTPSVSVRYSRADGATFNDPLEYAPIDVTVNSLISLCGARRNDRHGDIVLYVRVPPTNAGDDSAFLAEITDRARRAGTAVADVTFLANTYDLQTAFVDALINAGIADKLDAYASWNTAANTVGTALAEAIAAAVGRRTGKYNPVAHAQFMLDRYIDDYAFHAFVRPELIARLDAQGINDHTYLLSDAAVGTNLANRELLWPRALSLLERIYPQYGNAGLVMTLPWDRTFETELDVRLLPKS
ncbi:MAG: DUF4127 family protein [Candidatus Eremiobacteraeota bacterium]|nr:DUF4127 family protein [Candidatus Eremiobacteraeota bacterium]